MIAEFSIISLGGGMENSAEAAEALKIVDASGLPYQLTPLGICLEGNWEEIMTVVQLCHQRIRQMSPHVVTTIKIEDEEGTEHRISQNHEGG